MRIGLQLSSYDWPRGSAFTAPGLTTIARTAEDAGFASLWARDHVIQFGGDGTEAVPLLECYTTLGYLAAVTSRIDLGALVTGVVFRHPGMLVKIASTLDVLARGRTYFGIGVAWNEREAQGLGVPFPSTKERFERLEETLQIARQMWSGTVTPYTGKHFQLAEPIDSPQPLSRPHPPILIAGGGERKTLRLVAQYGDACNFLEPEPQAIRRKLAMLRQHCEAVGRDYETIERTSLHEIHLGPGGRSVADTIEFLRTLASTGIHHAIVKFPNTHELSPLETFGRDVIPAVTDL